MKTFLVRKAPSRSASVLIAVALLSLSLAGGSAASSPDGHEARGGAVAAHGGGDHRFVSGNSTFSDCGVTGSDYAISLTGDLEGCWSTFIRRDRCFELDAYDLYLESGREVFIGAYGGYHGKMWFKYTFEAAYEKGFCDSGDPSLEVGGGCTHKIIGGSGVFDDAEGLVKFIDVVAGVTGDPTTGDFEAGAGGNNFLYYGHILFDRHD